MIAVHIVGREMRLRRQLGGVWPRLRSDLVQLTACLRRDMRKLDGEIDDGDARLQGSPGLGEGGRRQEVV